MKARKTTSWWPNMVVLERVNAHFTLLETKAIVLVGFASVKIVGLASINIRQGQLFFVSFSSSALTGHVADIPQHLKVPSPKPSLHRFLKRQEEYFSVIYLASFPGNSSIIVVTINYFTSQIVLCCII